jgi:hypothetical protein
VVAPVSPEPAQDATYTPIPSSRRSLVAFEASLQSRFLLRRSQTSLPGMSQWVDDYPSPHLQTYSTMALAQVEF